MSSSSRFFESIIRRTRLSQNFWRLFLAASALTAFVGKAQAQDSSGNQDAINASTRALGSTIPNPARGAVQGQLFDSTTRVPLEGVDVQIVGTDFSALTDARGRFSFSNIPAGRYTVTYRRDGYAPITVEDVEVSAGKTAELDYAMSPRQPSEAENVVQLEAVRVTPERMTEQMRGFQVRLNADQVVNTFTPSDFSKFAAGDVADALKRISGVNVVKGQFAIIRGLEDRYSSVTYNGAPVPSPDPEAQSVQLDLFPSDIVSGMVIAKTFAGDLPGNSSGGSINIQTTDDAAGDSSTGLIDIKLSAGTGYNENARDRFLRFVPGSPTGSLADRRDIIESDVSVTISGLKRFGRDRFRYRVFAGQEIDYETQLGWQESREPLLPSPASLATRSSDLALGKLSLSNGLFELTQSTRTKQKTGYAGLGYHFRERGSHKIDASAFFTEKSEETVQSRENGFLPTFDYAAFAASYLPQDDINYDPTRFTGRTSRFASPRRSATEGVQRGALWFAPRGSSLSLNVERDLRVFQLNGEHRPFDFAGLKADWAANRAETTQNETFRGIDYFYEPTNPELIPTAFPPTPGNIGPGRYTVPTTGIRKTDNAIDEIQNFGRLDLEYGWSVNDSMQVTLKSGFFLEKASREVTSAFQISTPLIRVSPPVPPGTVDGGGTQVVIFGSNLSDLGSSIFPLLRRRANSKLLAGELETTSEADRLIRAFHGGAKITLWNQLDVLAGFRRENIKLEGRNDPFNRLDPQVPGTFGFPRIFPSKYLFFDRFDNPSASEFLAPAGTTFNDQILGLDVPVDPATGFVDIRTVDALLPLINRTLDERRFLPAFGLTWRATSQLTLRAAYSQSAARPSFRELGYYVSVQPGSSTISVGNPQLKLSDVESLDARVEYIFNDQGDLAAVSAFKKTIERPIESILLRDQADFQTDTQYRTFFNNPNDASLLGFEIEGRKSLDFIGFDFARHFSLGGNYTHIEAEVDRSAAEVRRAQVFFAARPGESAAFSGLATSRRLYNQPEWIANADLSFDHEDWGTKATLSYFAISDVLDAAGGPGLQNAIGPLSITLDRYIASFKQVDFTFSQKWRKWEFKLAIKNLTDSTRKNIYDPDQLVTEVAEREFKVGRDYSVSASYSF